MNLMRVYQTAGLIPQRLLFFLAVFADVHNLWRLVNAFAVFEDWNEKFAHGVGARREVCLFPCLDRIEEQKGILRLFIFCDTFFVDVFPHLNVYALPAKLIRVVVRMAQIIGFGTFLLTQAEIFGKDIGLMQVRGLRGCSSNN